MPKRETKFPVRIPATHTGRKAVQVRMDDELYVKLSLLAKRKGTTRSTLARDILVAVLM